MEISVKYRNVRIGPFSDYELKSAIQKYLRRDEPDKGILSLRLLLSVVSKIDDDPVRVKTILSNTMNRLVVMISEEVSLCEPSLPRLVEVLYKEYIKERDVRYILALYKTLYTCKKSRILSDIRAAFLLPFFDDHDLSLIDIQRHNDIVKPLSGGLVISKEDVSIMDWKKALVERDLHKTFIRMGHLLRPATGRKQKMNDMWNIMTEMTSLPLHIYENIQSLLFIYRKMTHREKTLYLYHAILLAILQPKPSPLKSFDVASLELKFDDLSKDIHSFKMDTYIKDMHTGKKDSTPYHFVMSGAWIYKEDKTFYNGVYRAIYIRKKQLLYNPILCFYDQMISVGSKSDDDKVFQSMFVNYSLSPIPDVLKRYTLIPLSSKSLETISALPHAQKKCGYQKKVVYVGKDFIYKGPYLRTDRSFQTLLFFQLAFEALEKTPMTILPIDVLYNENKDIYFMRSPNIGDTVNESDVETVSTKIESNVPVIKRGTTIFRVSERLEHLDTLQKKTCLKHLYLRFLLNIGDSGLYNLLIGKDQKIYGIDLEEQRNECKFDSIIGLLSPRTSKANEALLLEALPWVDLISENELTKMLTEEDWPTGFKENIIYRARFIECMLKHRKYLL